MSDTPTEPTELPADAGDSTVVDNTIHVDAPADTLDRLDGEIDAAYLERLKSESISHRLKAKEYREKFEPWQDALDGWDEEQAAAVRELLAAAKAGDTDAVAAILGLDTAAPPAAPAAPVPGDADYIKASDLDRILNERLSEREKQAEVAAQVQAIENEAKELGYEQGSNDYALLFKIAHEQTNGDLSAAHQKVQEWKQSLYDQFVAQKAAGATPPPAAGGPASGEREIRSFEDAKKAALERFGASQTT